MGLSMDNVSMFGQHRASHSTRPLTIVFYSSHIVPFMWGRGLLMSLPNVHIMNLIVIHCQASCSLTLSKQKQMPWDHLATTLKLMQSIFQIATCLYPTLAILLSCPCLAHGKVTRTSSTLEGSKSNINQPYMAKRSHKGHTHLNAYPNDLRGNFTYKPRVVVTIKTQGP